MPDPFLTDTTPMREWPLRFFTPREFKCKGSGRFFIPREVALSLEALRAEFGLAMSIVSAYRSPEHNRRVGGAEGSFHLKGRAFDISTATWVASDRARFLDLALKHGFEGHGHYKTFVHIDTGPRRVWWG